MAASIIEKCFSSKGKKMCLYFLVTTAEKNIYALTHQSCWKHVRSAVNLCSCLFVSLTCV